MATYLHIVLHELHVLGQRQSSKRRAVNLHMVENFLQITYCYQRNDYNLIQTQIKQLLEQNCRGQTLLFTKWEIASEILRVHWVLMYTPINEQFQWINIVKAVHGTFLMMEIMKSQLQMQTQFQQVIISLLQVQLREKLHKWLDWIKKEGGIAGLEDLLRRMQIRNIGRRGNDKLKGLVVSNPRE